MSNTDTASPPKIDPTGPWYTCYFQKPYMIGLVLIISAAILFFLHSRGMLTVPSWVKLRLAGVSSKKENSEDGKSKGEKKHVRDRDEEESELRPKTAVSRKKDVSIYFVPSFVDKLHRPSTAWMIY